MTLFIPLRAFDFIDSIGINTHIDFNNNGYQNIATMIAAINAMKIKNIRDCPANDLDFGNGPRSWGALAAATGAKFAAFIGETDLQTAAPQLNRMVTLAGQGVLRYVEGANEWDDAFPVGLRPPGTTVAQVLAEAQGFQKNSLFPMSRNVGLPALNMTFGSGWTAANGFIGDYYMVGDMSSWCDYGNPHTYPVGTQSAELSIDRCNFLATDGAVKSGGRVMTEFGFNESQFIPPGTQSDLARRCLWGVFDNMAIKTLGKSNHTMYFYALFNDGAGLFGMMNQDGTFKPQGQAIRNLMDILADIPTGIPGNALDYTLSGTTANDRQLLLQKTTGEYYLGMWNETDASHLVTLTLNGNAQVIKVYDPLNGIIPVQSLTNVWSVGVTVPTRPMIVQVTMGGAPPPPPPPPPPGPTPPVQVPVTVSLSPATLSLADSTPVAPVVSVGKVSTSDSLPFAGTMVADAPFTVAPDGSVTLHMPLSLTVNQVNIMVTATENGTTVSAPLALTITHAAPPPPPPPVPTQHPDPQWGPPSALVVKAGSAMPISGLAVSDQWAVGHAGQMALNAGVTYGTITANHKGVPVVGSGTHEINPRVGLSDVNVILSTLVYIVPKTSGSDVLVLEIWDQAGLRKEITIPIVIA